MSNIDLLLDEENELTFSLTIEGTRPAEAQCRLIVESQGMSLVFDSEQYDGDEVTVVLPPLKHVLKEGEYNMDLEVIVEDKYFRPLSMIGNFEKSIEIKAKPMIKTKKRSIQPRATVSEVKVNRRQKPVIKEAPATRSISPDPAPQKGRSPKQDKKTKVTDQQILQIIEALTKGKLDE